MDSSTAGAGAGGNGDVDRMISGLSDGLQQVILNHVRKAPAVTSTAALSLEDTDHRYNAAAPEHFAGFVDWVFAQRGDADMDSLRISMAYRECCPSMDKMNEWIRYGMQRVVGDFHLSIPYLGHGIPYSFMEEDDQPEADDLAGVVELPSYGRAASISLELSRLGLRFPAMATYQELTELTLDSVTFRDAEEGRSLGDFLSSCCPRLRRLDIQRPHGLTQLVLRVEALQELRIVFAFQLQKLDVTAPNLLALKLKLTLDVSVARIVAPRLQEIRMFIHPCKPQELHGLASVRSLGVIQLNMHAQYHHNEDDSFWLLRKCHGVEDVKVLLAFLHDGGRTKNHVVDAMLEGAETFPNVRSMRLKADFTRSDKDHLVPSIASLLIRFPRLTSLCIDFTGPKQDILRAKCFCDALGKWTDHGQITMEFLEEVKISGFTGASEELDLVSLLFKSSRSTIKNMSLSAASKVRYATLFKHKMKEDADEDYEEDGDDDSKKSVHLKLMDMPSTGSGNWKFGKRVYTWVCTTENTYTM